MVMVNNGTYGMLAGHYAKRATSMSPKLQNVGSISRCCSLSCNTRKWTFGKIVWQTDIYSNAADRMRQHIFQRAENVRPNWFYNPHSQSASSTRHICGAVLCCVGSRVHRSRSSMLDGHCVLCPLPVLSAYLCTGAVTVAWFDAKWIN